MERRHPRCRLLLLSPEGSCLVVIVDFVEQATSFRLERSVIDPGRPAGVGRRPERLATLSLGIVADDEVPRDEIDFFPMIVDERCGGVSPGVELQEPRAAARFPG